MVPFCIINRLIEGVIHTPNTHTQTYYKASKTYLKRKLKKRTKGDGEMERRIDKCNERQRNPKVYKINYTLLTTLQLKLTINIINNRKWNILNVDCEINPLLRCFNGIWEVGGGNMDGSMDEVRVFGGILNPNKKRSVCAMFTAPYP